MSPSCVDVTALRWPRSNNFINLRTERASDVVLFGIVLIVTVRLTWPEIVETVYGIDDSVHQLRLWWFACQACAGLDYEYRLLLNARR